MPDVTIANHVAYAELQSQLEYFKNRSLVQAQAIYELESANKILNDRLNELLAPPAPEAGEGGE